ncbi:hypothetical protein OBK23_11710, partial [Empedobacter falsenii]|uniref:hypothetical protein n=1 Tax=Empedobacter TaxID=59734 RepID=UPI00257520F1
VKPACADGTVTYGRVGRRQFLLKASSEQLEAFFVGILFCKMYKVKCKLPHLQTMFYKTRSLLSSNKSF